MRPHRGRSLPPALVLRLSLVQHMPCLEIICLCKSGPRDCQVAMRDTLVLVLCSDRQVEV